MVSPPEFCDAGSGADADWAVGKGVCQVKPSGWPPAAAAVAERAASAALPAMDGRRDPNPIGAASDSWPARSVTCKHTASHGVRLLCLHFLPPGPSFSCGAKKRRGSGKYKEFCSCAGYRSSVQLEPLMATR